MSSITFLESFNSLHSFVLIDLGEQNFEEWYSVYLVKMPLLISPEETDNLHTMCTACMYMLRVKRFECA